jgi:hypothetical protein
MVMLESRRRCFVLWWNGKEKRVVLRGWHRYLIDAGRYFWPIHSWMIFKILKAVHFTRYIWRASRVQNGNTPTINSKLPNRWWEKFETAMHIPSHLCFRLSRWLCNKTFSEILRESTSRKKFIRVWRKRQHARTTISFAIRHRSTPLDHDMRHSRVHAPWKVVKLGWPPFLRQWESLFSNDVRQFLTLQMGRYEVLSPFYLRRRHIVMHYTSCKTCRQSPHCNPDEPLPT